ncbi:hypothetical protein DFJ73DRAFT_957289 [Zopfochytrium polystomum]|nr:hypothetical protein DFJ73DRAFT_957289 [Zopfochytrium polystomum]
MCTKAQRTVAIRHLSPSPSITNAIAILLISSIIVSFLILPSARAIAATTDLQQGAGCAQGVRYLGTTCSTVVDYETSIAAANQSTVDASLSLYLNVLASIKSVDPNCYSALVALLCGVAYPKCANGTTSLPCQVACTTAVSVCTATFTSSDLMSQLNAATNNCTKVSTADPEPYPTTACFVPPAISDAAANQSATGGGGGGGVPCQRPARPDPRRVLCADEVTMATSKNNALCATNGAMVVFFSYAAVLWATYMIANVHLTIVWRSNLLQRYKLFGIAFCWGFPTAVTTATFLTTRVDASMGIDCFIAADRANEMVYAELSAFAIPAFFITIGTVVHLAVLSNRSWSSGASGSGGGTSSDGRAVNGGGGNMSVEDAYRPIRTRGQFARVVKTNWRALLFGVIFVLTYAANVIMFNVFVIPTAKTDPQAPWVQAWKLCVLQTFVSTNGSATATQDTCADEIAGNLPPLSALIAAGMASGTVGIWTFLIFGVNLQVLRDWREVCCGRRRQREKLGAESWGQEAVGVRLERLGSVGNVGPHYPPAQGVLDKDGGGEKWVGLSRTLSAPIGLRGDGVGSLPASTARDVYRLPDAAGTAAGPATGLVRSMSNGSSVSTRHRLGDLPTAAYVTEPWGTFTRTAPPVSHGGATAVERNFGGQHGNFSGALPRETGVAAQPTVILGRLDSTPQGASPGSLQYSPAGPGSAGDPNATPQMRGIGLMLQSPIPTSPRAPRQSEESFDLPALPYRRPSHGAAPYDREDGRTPFYQLEPQYALQQRAPPLQELKRGPNLPEQTERRWQLQPANTTFITGPQERGRAQTVLPYARDPPTTTVHNGPLAYRM